MIPIETAVRVSQYAMDLVMAGKAYFGSGGVRLIENDRFVELYKLLPSFQTQQPGIMPIHPYIPALPVLTEIALQAFNSLPQIANVVLSYKNGQKLNKVINMLSTLQGIAWANTAIGAANMALTAMRELPDKVPLKSCLKARIAVLSLFFCLFFFSIFPFAFTQKRHDFVV